MRKAEDALRILEIRRHVTMLFIHYGEDEAYFPEYLTGVLAGDHALALECFRSLVGQLREKDIRNAGRMLEEKKKCARPPEKGRLCTDDRR